MLQRCGKVQHLAHTSKAPIGMAPISPHTGPSLVPHSWPLSFSDQSSAVCTTELSHSRTGIIDPSSSATASATTCRASVSVTCNDAT